LNILFEFHKIVIRIKQKFKGGKMNDYNQNNQVKKERRKHSRKIVITPVDYKVMVPSGDRSQTQNISEGGIRLMLSKAFTQGTILEFRLDLPGESKPIQRLAKVVWQQRTDEGFLTGVKFETS